MFPEKILETIFPESPVFRGEGFGLNPRLVVSSGVGRFCIAVTGSADRSIGVGT